MSRSARSRTRIFTGQTRPRESALSPRSNRKTLPFLRHGVARLQEAHLGAIAGRRCLPPINPPRVFRSAEAFRPSTESSRQFPRSWVHYIPTNPQGKELSSKMRGADAKSVQHSTRELRTPENKDISPRIPRIGTDGTWRKSARPAWPDFSSMPLSVQIRLIRGSNALFGFKRVFFCAFGPLFAL